MLLFYNLSKINILVFNNFKKDFFVFSYASVYWLCNYFDFIRKILRLINILKSKNKKKKYNPVNLRRKENFDIVKNIVNKSKSVKPLNLLEIGAGKTLIDPIKRSQIGNLNQYVIDIENQLSYKEVIYNLKKYRKDKDTSSLNKKNLKSFLEHIGIFYLVSQKFEDLVPILPEINIFYSINTFEHIPSEDIKKIFQNFKLMRSKDAISLHLIDFSDHYSSIPGVSEWNFYRYGNLSWKFLNPPYFYQNRLRHNDYLRIFKSYGLEIDPLLTRKFYSNDTLNIKTLNKEITDSYSFKDLKNTATRFILR